MFGAFYYGLKDWIEGTSSDVVHVEESDPQSIGNSTTLQEDCDSESSISQDLLGLCQEVSARAKAQGLVGKTITFQVKGSCCKMPSAEHATILY